MADVYCEDHDYEILLEKDGQTISRGQKSRLRTVSYGRVLDGISTAEVDIKVPGADCLGQLGAVDHWNTTLTVLHRDTEVWHGPVKQSRIALNGDYCRINAVDLLGWGDKRYPREDITYTDEDLSTIGRGVFEHCVMGVDAPDARIHEWPSGIRASREMLVSQNRKCWAILSEMLDTGLDVTTFGRQVLFGLPLFEVKHITNRDIIGDVELVRDGDDMATWVAMDAQNKIMGSYPDERRGQNGYPLLEEIMSDSQLTDEESALAAAKRRYEWSQNGVRRVRADGGLQITPTSKLDARTLICGQPINFTSEDMNVGPTETLRLGSVNVQVDSAGEAATIDLQPLGNYGEYGV